MQLDGANDSLSNNENSVSDDNSANTNEMTIKDTLTEDDYCMNFLLTNARSLTPKIDSLLHAFGSLRLHFACVTETWFRGGTLLEQSLGDLEGASGVKTIHRSRDGRVRKMGGGVAFMFDTSTFNFRKRALCKENRKHEMLCVAGKVGKIPRKIVVITVYIPPDLKIADVNGLFDALTVEVAAAKAAYKNPIIMVGGDFNRRDVGAALKDADDMEAIITGPTRGR